MRIILLAWLSWAAFAVSAQTDSVYLDAVEIKRFKRIVSAADLEIEPMRMGGVSDDPIYALRYFSPTFIKRYGSDGYVTISLDGMNPKHTSTFWNGIPVNNTLTGISDLSIFLHAQDLSINIPRGSHTMAHTSAQLGGILWMESSYIPEDKLEVTANFGSFLRRSVDLTANYSLDSANVILRLKGGYQSALNDYSFYNYNTDPVVLDKMEEAGFKRYYLEAGLDWKINNKHQFTWTTLYQDTDRRIPPSVVSPNNLGRNQEQVLRMAVNLQSVWESWDQQINVGYSMDDLDYREMAGEQLVLQTEQKVHQFSLQNQWSKRIKQHQLGWSANMVYDHIAGDGLSQPNTLQGGLAGLWSMKTWRDRLFISAAARGDFHQTLKAAPSGHMDVQLLPSPNLPITLFAVLARHVKFPSVTDLYFEPSGNPDLQTEASWKISGGYKIGIRAKNWSLDQHATIYRSWIDDMILWVPSNKQYWQPINLKKVDALGFQVSQAVGWEGNGSLPRFAVHVTYQWAKTTNGANIEQAEGLFPNDVTIGKQLPYIPKHQFKINPMIGYHGLYIRWAVQYVSQRFVTGSNSYYLERYWLADVQIGYEHTIGPIYFDLQFRIHNAFNNDYYQEVAHIPMPFRNYSFKMILGAQR